MIDDDDVIMALVDLHAEWLAGTDTTRLLYIDHLKNVFIIMIVVMSTTQVNLYVNCVLPVPLGHVNVVLLRCRCPIYVNCVHVEACVMCVFVCLSSCFMN